MFDRQPIVRLESIVCQCRYPIKASIKFVHHHRVVGVHFTVGRNGSVYKCSEFYFRKLSGETYYFGPMQRASNPRMSRSDFLSTIFELKSNRIGTREMRLPVAVSGSCSVHESSHSIRFSSRCRPDRFAIKINSCCRSIFFFVAISNWHINWQDNEFNDIFVYVQSIYLFMVFP